MKVTVRARASSRAQMHTQLCSVLAGQRRLVRIWSFFKLRWRVNERAHQAALHMNKANAIETRNPLFPSTS